MAGTTLKDHGPNLAREKLSNVLKNGMLLATSPPATTAMRKANDREKTRIAPLLGL